jgi:hypothetical protein
MNKKSKVMSALVLQVQVKRGQIINISLNMQGRWTVSIAIVLVGLLTKFDNLVLVMDSLWKAVQLAAGLHP